MHCSEVAIRPRAVFHQRPVWGRGVKGYDMAFSVEEGKRRATLRSSPSNGFSSHCRPMQRIMRVFCEEQGFDFECSSSSDLFGTLHTNQSQRDWLHEREKREDESEQQPWYLDEDGERLPPEALFERSPWSIETASGKVKVLLRLFNAGTGEARFNLPDAYPGEWFRWMREKSADE